MGVIFMDVSKKQAATRDVLLSCEFCQISKNTFFTEHLWATASEKHFRKKH